MSSGRGLVAENQVTRQRKEQGSCQSPGGRSGGRNKPGNTALIQISKAQPVRSRARLLGEMPASPSHEGQSPCIVTEGAWVSTEIEHETNQPKRHGAA